jgi:hypothetical protein
MAPATSLSDFETNHLVSLSPASPGCPICKVACDSEDPAVRVKSCDHVFGKLCLLEWLKANDTCPICRKKLIRSRAYEGPVRDDLIIRMMINLNEPATILIYQGNEIITQISEEEVWLVEERLLAVVSDFPQYSVRLQAGPVKCVYLSIYLHESAVDVSTEHLSEEQIGTVPEFDLDWQTVSGMIGAGFQRWLNNSMKMMIVESWSGRRNGFELQVYDPAVHESVIRADGSWSDVLRFGTALGEEETLVGDNDFPERVDDFPEVVMDDDDEDLVLETVPPQLLARISDMLNLAALLEPQEEADGEARRLSLSSEFGAFLLHYGRAEEETNNAIFKENDTSSLPNPLLSDDDHNSDAESMHFQGSSEERLHSAEMPTTVPEAEEEREQYYNADGTPMDPDSDNNSSFAPDIEENVTSGDAQGLWKDFDWSIEEGIECTSSEDPSDPVPPCNSGSPAEQTPNEVSDATSSVKKHRSCCCFGPLKNKVQEAFARLTGRCCIGLVPKM